MTVFVLTYFLVAVFSLNAFKNAGTTVSDIKDKYLLLPETF